MQYHNIGLPVDTDQEFKRVAAVKEISVERLIEEVLIDAGKKFKIEVRSTNPNNPSPSGDPWWDDPENVAMVERGIEDVKAGRCTVMSMEEIEKMLGL